MLFETRNVLFMLGVSTAAFKLGKTLDAVISDVFNRDEASTEAYEIFATTLLENGQDGDSIELIVPDGLSLDIIGTAESRNVLFMFAVSTAAFKLGKTLDDVIADVCSEDPEESEMWDTFCETLAQNGVDTEVDVALLMPEGVSLDFDR